MVIIAIGIILVVICIFLYMLIKEGILGAPIIPEPPRKKKKGKGNYPRLKKHVYKEFKKQKKRNKNENRKPGKR